MLPRAMLLAMFDVLGEWFDEPACKQGIFISACDEYPLRDHPVRRAARSGRRAGCAASPRLCRGQ
jgi:hypothetical protein